MGRGASTAGTLLSERNSSASAIAQHATQSQVSGTGSCSMVRTTPTKTNSFALLRLLGIGILHAYRTVRERLTWFVRFVPEADQCAAAKALLFDHLVGAGERCRRHREAKHPGGLEIDHQLVLVRPLYGQVAWFNPPDRTPGSLTCRWWSAPRRHRRCGLRAGLPTRSRSRSR